MAVFWASSYPLGRHLAQFEVPAVVAGLRLLFATSFLRRGAAQCGLAAVCLLGQGVAPSHEKNHAISALERVRLAANGTSWIGCRFAFWGPRGAGSE